MSHSRRSRQTCLGRVVCTLLLGSTAIFAQTGSVEVRVRDAATGEPLAGATVVLGNAQGLVARTATVADAQGVSLFPVLRAGPGYEVRISMPGYAGQRRADVRVSSNVTELIEVSLSPEIQERVQVRAQRDVVDIGSSGTSSRFSDTFIEHLPVEGRFYQNILKLAPGVNDPDGDGDPYVHGARKRDFQTYVAGVSNVDPLTGLRLSYVHPEAIEELVIETSGAGIALGRAQGGGARILLKQGTNEFEGVFGFIYRSSIFDGSGAADLIGVPTPKFDWIQPSVQLSGPIVKDRFWYRLSHEYLDRQDPVNVLSRLETRNRTLSLNADQITWQASPRNQLAFQFQSDPQTVENLELSSAVTRQSSQTIRNGGPTYSMTWSAAASPRLFVDSVLAYQDHAVEIFPSEPAAQQTCLRFRDLTVLNGSRCNMTDLNLITGAYPETTSDRRLRLTLRSEATYFTPRLLGASHRFKLGFTVENERYFRELERRPEITNFFSTFSPFGGTWTGRATVVVPVPGRSSSEATSANWGLYVEDQVRLPHHVSLTLGLRVDREEIEFEGKRAFDPATEAATFLERYAEECDNEVYEQYLPAGCAGRLARETFTAFEDFKILQNGLADALDVNPVHVRISSTALQSSSWFHQRGGDAGTIQNTNFSPRLAVAWDPLGDGKTKVALTLGRYYGRIPLLVPLVEQEPQTTTFQFRTRPSATRRNFVAADESLDGVDATISTQVVDRGLKIPYQDERTISVERELWAESSIKLTYIRRKFRDQIQDVDINHDAGLTLNPGWGEILRVGNYNSGDYRAWVLEFLRRQYRSWQLNASYTYSKAEGDAEDFLQPLGNINLDSLQEDERSFLDYDQRHQVKINGITLTRWGFRLGGSIRWESGLPYSITRNTFLQFQSPPEYFSLGVDVVQSGFAYPTGRRNDQRNESFWTVDSRVSWDVPVPGRSKLEMTAEVFNVLNDDALRQSNDEGLIVAERRFGRQFQLGLRLEF